MRFRTTMAALFALAGLLVAVQAGAQQQRPGPRPGLQQQQQQAGPSFTLRNDGSRALREFYASPPSDSGWGDDRLGSEMVAPGQSFRLQLPRGFGCVQDLRAVFEDDSAVERRGANICQERIQAFRNAEPDAEVTVINGFDRTLFQLFFRPQQGGDDWGPDRLGNDTVEPGQRETVRFSAGGSCRFDIRIVFDNDSAEERRGVDLCRTPVLAFAPGWTTAEAMPGEATTARPAPAAPQGSPQARPVPPAAAQGGGITIRNQGTAPIVRLSLDPPGAGAPGPDRLGDAVIGPGGSLAVQAPQGLCVGDVTATFRDGSTARRERASLCDGAEITLP